MMLGLLRATLCLLALGQPVAQEQTPEQREATETVTPMLGANGSWKVSGYYIK